MIKARGGLRKIYAQVMEKNVVEGTLKEMLARGLPRELYDQYREEAIMKGLIPVAGKSVVGGRVITEEDILKASEILAPVPKGFEQDLGWYGIG